jgi:hypothetical protein
MGSAFHSASDVCGQEGWRISEPYPVAASGIPAGTANYPGTAAQPHPSAPHKN